MKGLYRRYHDCCVGSAKNRKLGTSNFRAVAQNSLTRKLSKHHDTDEKLQGLRYTYFICDELED